MSSSSDLDNYKNYIVIGVIYWRDWYVPEWHYGSVASKWPDAQMGRDSDSYGNTILYANIDLLCAQGMAVPPAARHGRVLPMCLIAQDWLSQRTRHTGSVLKNSHPLSTKKPRNFQLGVYLTIDLIGGISL